ncbi:DUF2971 domain-containing protein [Acinetobacter bereziniae]|uniref:DUF2971 domain-containing protein n=1 Tax=Acinetobacter bereziniae TaxID=106648 RepID=UPI0021CE31ED|nr:DUF2971 domain-containing protein [Acinetobacter bereziniae]MCU4436114.1 DUF2971 domain-containing protein [Acinetobacter bereziniae]
MKYEAEHVRECFKNLIQDENYYYLYKHIAIDPDMLVFGIFTKTQLKYNFPSFFNDPFDCLFDITIDSEKFTKNEFENITMKKISDQDWKKVSKSALNKINDKTIVRKLISKLRTEMLSVTCFNANPLSILMWSHYANNHKGMLLEFKIPKIDSKMFPIPVLYDDEYPTINIPWYKLANPTNETELIHEITRETIFRKSTEWEYEKEFRLIGNKATNANNPLLQPYPPEYLSSVIMGANLNDENITKQLNEEIKKFNSKNNLSINIYKAQLKKGHYLLEVPNHPRLS